MSLVDLRHTVEHDMITYKGLPAPIICDFLSRTASRDRYSKGTEFHIGRIDMVANTGTYVDAPFHRYANGRDLSELPLESLANLQTEVIRSLDGNRPIGADLFRRKQLKGKAVLVHTGWDKHWRTDHYFEGHPFLTSDAAEYLAEQGVRFVGIDSYNIDDTNDGTRPVHSTLLSSDIPICEHMCGLATLPDADFRLFAVPVKVKAFGTFPVRAFASIADGLSPDH